MTIEEPVLVSTNNFLLNRDYHRQSYPVLPGAQQSSGGLEKHPVASFSMAHRHPQRLLTPCSEKKLQVTQLAP